jgi:hypothetical protein
MKKLFFIAAFVSVLFITEKAQAQLNINVGYATEFMTSENITTGDTTFFFNGFYAGLNWKFELIDNLNLTAGAQYRMNLGDLSEHVYYGAGFVHHVIRQRQTLVDIPIMLNYDMAASSKVTISPFAGPMLSWGITGETKEQWLYPLDTEFHHKWYDENGEQNRFNVYGMAGVKVCFYRFTISVGGRYGFLDLNKNDDTTTKAYGFFLSFGHDF